MISVQESVAGKNVVIPGSESWTPAQLIEYAAWLEQSVFFGARVFPIVGITDIYVFDRSETT